MEAPRILAINPGSTSTKIAVFDRLTPVFTATLRHTREELAPYGRVMEQYEFRKRLILAQMKAHEVYPDSLTAVVGRGGLLRPMPGGTYMINEAMLDDLRAGVGGEHVCNLGGLIAHAIAAGQGIPCYIVDPPVVDELEPIARISGMPEIVRESRFHTLSHRSAGHKAAKSLGRPYAQLRLVIAHMGGGISVTAHDCGRAADTNNGVDSEGSYTPERAGTLPVRALMRLCYGGNYTFEEMKRKTVGEAGLMGYLGTNDAQEIVARIHAGDAYARLIYEGMGYQIAKEIGAYATVLKGDVDAVCLTGGLAHDAYLTDYITDRVRYIAPVFVFPGEDELTALTEGVLRVLDGEEAPKEYGGEMNSHI